MTTPSKPNAERPSATGRRVRKLVRHAVRTPRELMRRLVIGDAIGERREGNG